MNFESSAAQSQSIFSNRSPTSVADYYNPSGRFIFRPENGNSFPENIYLPADEDKDHHRYLSSSSSSVISAPSPSSPSIAPAPPSYENNEIILPEEVTINDVLCGRGRGPANHLGNVRFRQIVGQHRATYLMCKDRKVKAQICNDIVHAVQCSNPPGRFLKQIPSVSTLGGSGDSTKSAWMCIDDVKARMKTGQALREGYTKDTIQRARLLATVAFSGRPMSGTKRNAAEEECNHYPDVETKKSNKRMRITDTPDTMEGVGQQRLPLKKDIMRRVKEDRLRENSLSAWMGSKGCL